MMFVSTLLSSVRGGSRCKRANVSAEASMYVSCQTVYYVCEKDIKTRLIYR